MAKILVVEDHDVFRETLAELLTDEAYEVRTASDGREGLAAFDRFHPDLVLLDVMMPGLDGYAVCAAIREKDPLVPVLMLTAKKNAENDRVRGLRRGADDYIDKTVGTRELLARIASALRRSKAVADVLPAPPSVPEMAASFMFGSHRVDTARYKLITPRGRKTDLSPREVKILHLLVTRPGVAVGREEFISFLWEGNYAGTTRSIDQSIWRLREKLGSDGVRLATVHGAGYCYRP